MSTVTDELHKIYDSAYERAYQLSFESAAQRGIAAIGDRHVYAHRMALFAANSAYRSAQARVNREELTAPAPEELVAGPENRSHQPWDPVVAHEPSL